MLLLTRKLGEAIRIGSEIRVRVVALQGSQVRIAIEAPEAVAVHREEVYERIARANLEATRGDDELLRSFGARAADEEGDA